MDNVSKRDLFEQTFLPHLDSAYNLARWLTHNDHDAEDLVQEAYLRAFRFFDAFKGGDGKPWLLAVVRNTCFTWLRHNRNKIATISLDQHPHQCSSGSTNIEEQLLSRDRHRALQECLESLPSGYKEVIIMREIEEMSYKQISEATALPIGTVMSRLSRARARLAAYSNLPSSRLDQSLSA